MHNVLFFHVILCNSVLQSRLMQILKLNPLYTTLRIDFESDIVLNQETILNQTAPRIQIES